MMVALAVMVLPGLAAPPASAEAATALKRYPYLTDAVGTNVTVNWATDRSATTGAVRWGSVNANGSCTPATSVTAARTSISVNGVSQYQWKATLSLGNAAEFCYRVYLGSTNLDLLGTDPTPQAKPQVPAGSSEAYSFAVLGDSGEVDTVGDNAGQSNVMRHIANSGARFAVQVGDFGHPNNDQNNFGDLVQKGANLSAIFGPAFWKNAGTKIPMFTVPGNHGITNNALLVNFPQDRAVSTSSGTYAMQTYCCVNGTTSQSQQSGWYAFNAGKARYYMLTAAWSDNNLGTLPGTERSPKLYQNDYDTHWTPSSAEYQWLKADLEANRNTPVKMAFFHFPMYSDQKAESSDTFLQGANSLEGLLTSNGVDIAFNGHAHIYQRNKPSPLGLVTYLTGGGGARSQSVGETACSAIDAYGIGWSNSRSTGNKCGAAPVPTSLAEVYHYLLVTVNGTDVTVKPVNSLGDDFDVQTYSFPAPPDPVAPSVPAGLTATATSATSVDLSWTASTDNVAVTGYDVYRNGTLLKTVTGTSTTDTPVAASTTYSYTVRARDEAGNTSNLSSPATVTTGADSGQAVFTAAADAQVAQASPTTNYGTTTTIAADQSSTAQLESYLKFDVTGLTGTPTSAKLRVWTTPGTSSPTNNGPAVYPVADTSWTETGINWGNKPATGAAALDNKAALTADTMVEYDVTSLITGNGTYTLNLRPDSTDGTSFNSRTNATTAKRPQLVVTTGAGSPGDTERPSVPTGLTATATSSSSVDLSWNASTDNVAVTEYDIFRNGTPLKTVTGTSTTDTPVSASTTYSYTVRARDEAGNASSFSTQATVTTGAPTAGGESVFGAAADAQVQQANPTANFGTNNTLAADQSSTAQLESFLKFNVTGLPGTPTNAKLRVWTTTGTSSPTSNGPAVYPVADTSWTETGINWGNKPAVGTTALDNKAALTADTMVEYDVTSMITGNGTYALSLMPDSTDGTTFNSRTATTTTKRPQLVVTTGAGSPGDTEAPSVPTGLTATAASSTSVDLSWTAATDNVAVTEYEVFRNGTLLKAVTGTSTSDTTAVANTTYSYTVKAKDAANNTSAASAAASATTPPAPTGGGETVFAPTADAEVQQASATANFGTATAVGADVSSTSQIESYLKFDVTGLTGTPTNAKLRLWTTTSSSSATGNGPAVYSVADTTWTETGITWGNKPPAGTTALDNKAALRADTMVEYDVTALVTGNGIYTIKLMPDSSDGTDFNSRTGTTTTKRPQLVVTTG